jgi:DNA-binding transcriptional MerR regulator
MRIGELSHRTGVSRRLLRSYEEQGLLSPERRPSGYREYTHKDVEAVRRVRCLLSAGLGTATIAAIMPCLRSDGERLVPTCPQLRDDLQRERDRIDDAIAGLRASRRILDTVIGA